MGETEGDAEQDSLCGVDGATNNVGVVAEKYIVGGYNCEGTSVLCKMEIRVWVLGGDLVDKSQQSE